MPKKVLAARCGNREGQRQQPTPPTPSGQHCPLQGTLGWTGQELTLQLSALARNGEGTEDLS